MVAWHRREERAKRSRRMNPYAANFQVSATAASSTSRSTAVAAAGNVGLAGEGEEAGWVVDEDDQNGDGAGGYWDEHGQHHPGYGGEFDPAAAAYHPEAGYEGAAAGYHAVRFGSCDAYNESTRRVACHAPPLSAYTSSPTSSVYRTPWSSTQKSPNRSHGSIAQCGCYH